MLTLTLAFALAVQEETVPETMKPLANLIGQWDVKGNLPDGTPLHTRNVYSWGVGKRVIHVRTYAVADEIAQPQYENVMFYHPRHKRLVNMGFSAAGEVVEQFVSPDPRNPRTMLYGYEPFHGAEATSRSSVTFTDDDSFVRSTFVKQGDEWKRLLKLEGKRTASGD